ncbi:MAG: GntR family transcriptional regulator [Prevotella sp.]|jgi:DNA-binding transcriptional regulator YhcF (GntR family)
MEFNPDKAIYLQIADRLSDEILSGKYKTDDRVPSVREYSVLVEVNTNTTVKAYDELARRHIIYNKRGLGYFVSAEAKQIILESRRDTFFKQTLPELFRQMHLLGVDISQVDEVWNKMEQSRIDKV